MDRSYYNKWFKSYLVSPRIDCADRELKLRIDVHNYKLDKSLKLWVGLIDSNDACKNIFVIGDLSFLNK